MRKEDVFEEVTSRVNMNIEGVAAIFGIILLVFIMIDRKHNLQSFRVLAVTAVVSDIFDLVTTYVTFSVDSELFYSKFIVVLLNTLNYFGFGLLSYVLFRYLKSYFKPNKLIHTMINVADFIFSVYIVFLIISIFWPGHFIIDYDFSTERFVRTPFSYIIGYGIPLFIVTSSIFMMVVFNKDFSSKQKKTIFAGYMVVVIGCLIQACINARVLVAHATGILSFVILYFSLESPDYKRMSALLDESRKAQERIKEAQKAREDLFAGMTHEIRTPLNAVLGINQLIAEEDKDPVVGVLTGKIKREGESVLKVVNRILNQAKTEDQVFHQKTGMPDLSGKHILSIDDTPINLRIIEGLLNHTGASVTSVSGGREGLDLMTREHFDLVLIDHQMPVMDGMATMRRMTESGLAEHTPVIMVTGNDGEEYARMYEKAGFSGYVRKPVKQDELFSVISQAIGGKEVL